MKKGLGLSPMSYRFMRTLLFFDLPTYTLEDRKNYRKFVKLIKTNGFYMLQESVYCRMSIDQQMADTVANRLKASVPPDGNIMLLNVTEKQFSSMQILLGESNTDVLTSDERVVFL